MAGALVGVSNAGLALGSSVPQYVLAATDGSAAVARYGVLLYVVLAAEVFWAAYTQAWLPAAVAARAGGGAGVRREVGRRVVSWTLRSMALAALAIPLLVATLPRLFAGLTAETPVEALLLGSTVVALPLLWFSTAGLTAANLYRRSLLNSVLAVCGALAASVVLVPAFGLAGALGANLAYVVTRGAAAYAQLFRARGSAGHPLECATQ
jgi:hypothetical protein